ncbi:MAG: Modification methylase PaeR7I, partial [Planctomycetota bacterium]
MINRQTLLTDLQRLLQRLEADLLERSESTEIVRVGEALRQEYEQAKAAARTAQNYEDWRSDTITQHAAAWVLSCVFVRFLEDNRLLDPPRISGQRSAVSDQHSADGCSRLQLARDEQELYFRSNPRQTDRDYLLAVFDQLKALPATADVFGDHNPLRQLPDWLSGDAAGELLRFFQKINADDGLLIHDFTDPEWNTRFLGDLYQDLSEAARKKYALLQTPDFVEAFILDRTLEPALDEFGLTGKRSAVSGQQSAISDPQSAKNKKLTADSLTAESSFKLIDPACGSGHFLLGAFPRILGRWQRLEPATGIAVLVQRTLDSIHGVDVNPFAIAIARFRLLLVAMRACGVQRLADAPAFRLHLACGDSLYHGRQRYQVLDADWQDEAHYFRSEDTAELRRILREGTYHAVVANPPYITPKDAAANRAYRQLYPRSCHMKYSLSVPFMERLFALAIRGTTAAVSTARAQGRNLFDDEESSDSPQPTSPGFVGQITANSFMKREFGKKLIEDYFPTVDLTHVIDTSGAYIPGHGTPTVILFGRNRQPLQPTIRTVLGIRGEPSTPEDPAEGRVWTAILQSIDHPSRAATVRE